MGDPRHHPPPALTLRSPLPMLSKLPDSEPRHPRLVLAQLERDAGLHFDPRRDHLPILDLSRLSIDISELCHSYPCPRPRQFAEHVFTANGYSMKFA